MLSRYTKRKAEGGSEPPFAVIASLAAGVDVSLDWVATGKGPMRTSERMEDMIQEERRTLYKTLSPEEFVFIARYDAEVSAGYGAICEEDRVRDRLAFKRSWIREMGMQPDKLALVTVKGDSMEPNLFHGDIVLVDLSTPGITVDGIYVLRTDDGLVVKRLQRMITGDIYIKSDNPAYEVQTVPRDRLDQVHILGRAVWLGRHL